jgi:hypothetical protein
MNLILGRYPSAFDARDGNYRLASYIPKLTGLDQSRDWPYNADPLDQMDKPHCVGFAGVNWEVSAPTESIHTNQDGHDLYYLCKKIEGEPGLENGSTVRCLALALRLQKRLKAFAWASSVDEISWWLLNRGPVVCGTNWTYDMFQPSSEYVIQPTGKVEGGHAYIINEKKEGFYGIMSSWDNYWGYPGKCKAYIEIGQFSELLRQQGEVMTAVEEPVTQKGGCLAALLGSLGRR